MKVCGLVSEPDVRWSGACKRGDKEKKKKPPCLVLVAWSLESGVIHWSLVMWVWVWVWVWVLDGKGIFGTGVRRGAKLVCCFRWYNYCTLRGERGWC